MSLFKVKKKKEEILNLSKTVYFRIAMGIKRECLRKANSIIKKSTLVYCTPYEQRKSACRRRERNNLKFKRKSHNYPKEYLEVLKLLATLILLQMIAFKIIMPLMIFLPTTNLTKSAVTIFKQFNFIFLKNLTQYSLLF